MPTLDCRSRTVKGEPSASFLDEAFQELQKLHGEERE